MHSRLKIGITILALAAAGCAGQPTTSAAGGTQAPALDATTPILTFSGDPLISRSSAPVTGRDWNCPRCYK